MLTDPVYASVLWVAAKRRIFQIPDMLDFTTEEKLELNDLMDEIELLINRQL